MLFVIWMRTVSSSTSTVLAELLLTGCCSVSKTPLHLKDSFFFRMSELSLVCFGGCWAVPLAVGRAVFDISPGYENQSFSPCVFLNAVALDFERVVLSCSSANSLSTVVSVAEMESDPCAALKFVNVACLARTFQNVLIWGIFCTVNE